MKKIITILSIFVCLATFAQENSDTMFIYRGNTIERILVSEIDSVTFISPSTIDMPAVPEYFAPEAIDLGLSVKWASCNVGATKPEEYGGYYAWGETEEKDTYYKDGYKYYNVDSDDYINIGSDISGTKYDVAHVKWGGSWRMPTKTEIQELVEKCTWKWTNVNGVYGQLATGPNGNSIFLPAAGYRYGTEVYYTGYSGYYWSSTPNESLSSSAYVLYFSNGYHFWDYWYGRNLGHGVRPVSE